MADQPHQPSLLDRTFRANPNYRLTLFDRLPEQQQQALAGLRDDPDLYGLLTADHGDLRPKAVTQQTALLFLSLQHPGTLPFYVVDHATEDVTASISQLVSDGVLEMQVGDVYVSGTQAHGLLFPPPAAPEQSSSISNLSLQALRYGASLDGLGTAELSGRLYRYNRIPLSGHWRAAFTTPDALKAHWGIPRGIESLSHRWRTIHTGSDDWISWRQSGLTEQANQHQPTYKLYVSPQPQHVADSLAATVAVLTHASAPSLKIGGKLAGLLRPDKIVCYFNNLDQLNEAAADLAAKLEGIPAHGVPFTSELAPAGLTSWGIDPAAAEQAFGWQGRQSWRLWVTNHLAASLVAAGSTSIPRWQVALDRLSLEGVDPHTWAPRDLSRLASTSDKSKGVGAWR